MVRQRRSNTNTDTNKGKGNKVTSEDVVSLGRPQPKQVCRSQPQKEVERSSTKSRSGKPAIKKSISVDGERPDMFVELGFDKMCKADVEVDKKLSHTVEPPERGTRKTLVEIDCASCGKTYSVSPVLIFNDPDDGPIYKCDNCISGRGRKHAQRPNRKE